jgi:membrane protein implicated in regulation of membrane protease activity
VAQIKIGDKSWRVEGDGDDIASALVSGQPFLREVEGRAGVRLVITPTLAWAEISDERDVSESIH